MPIRAEQFFPSWIAVNFVLFPPAFIFLAFMFCVGVFFEIDFRLISTLSFGDYLVFFTLFLFSFVVFVFAFFGFCSWVWKKIKAGRFAAWVMHSELLLSKRLRWLMVGLMIGGNFVPSPAGAYVSIVFGFVVFGLFLVPLIAAYESADVGRFRVALLALVFVLAFPFNAFGTLAGRVLLFNSQRVYLLRLQSGLDEYVNVLLYTSTGVIYRLDEQVRFAPYDSIVFTRRTGRKRKM